MHVLIILFYIVIVPLVLYIAYRTYQKYSLKSKWHFISSKKFAEADEQLLVVSFHPYQYLTNDEQQRLKLKILFFIEYKTFNAIADFEITHKMKILIAAQACLLILNFNTETEVYPELFNIYISATPFVDRAMANENLIDMQTMLPQNTVRLGEAWVRGPLVLSWSSVKDGLDNWKDGHNVVIHEFAHKLDANDGHMDGTPTLVDDGSSYKKWEIFMSKEFIGLRRKVSNHQKSDIDKYGAVNEAEFFAVTVEQFFEKTVVFKNKHPDLFRIYRDYFNINPLVWSS